MNARQTGSRTRALRGIAVFMLAASAALPALAGEPAKAEASADWPQWRGPTRDGVVPNGPKLLDSWPANGPKLLWKSEPIPSGLDGGCGSVVVAGGKVFVYVHWRRQHAKVVLTPQALAEMGWVEGMPEDLAQKVEEARLSPKREGGYVNPAVWDAFIKDFIAGLDPAQAKKYGTEIRDRMTKPMHGVVGLTYLKRLAKVCNKEFPSVEALLGAAGVGFGGHDFDGNMAQKRLLETCFDYTDTVFCLDAATGKEIWKKEFPGAPYGNGAFCGASGTPAVDGNKCYVPGTAALYCLAVKDGALIWQSKLKSFSNSSPLVANDAVYLGMEEGMTAFNAGNGQVLWTQAEAKNGCCSAVLWTTGGKNYLVCGGDKKVLCLEPGKGTVMWQAGVGQTVYATPAISDDIMVTMGDYSSLVAWKITPQKAEQIWTGGAKLGDRGSSPLIYQDHVYHPPAEYGRMICCMDLKTGARKWTQLVPGGVCSPIVADGKIIASVNDFIIMYKATPEKYEELGRFPIPKGMRAWTSPAFAGGKLYLRHLDGIVCYDLTAR